MTRYQYKGKTAKVISFQYNGANHVMSLEPKKWYWLPNEGPVNYMVKQDLLTTSVAGKEAKEPTETEIIEPAKEVPPYKKVVGLKRNQA